MNYDDETLMAYADGELDEAQRADIEAAIARDPVLASRVARHRALRAEVADAFAGVLEQPVPAQLEAAALRTAARAEPRGNVVPFPARASRAPATAWRAREWTAMAASVVLGAFLSWRFLAPEGGDFGNRNDTLVAQGQLAQALESQLASEQDHGAAVLIGLTFKSAAGEFCRSFIMRDPQTYGLACRSDGSWRIPVITEFTPAGGDYRTATTTMPETILRAIEARRDQDALDSVAEKAARDSGWK
jgi:hypothetical protein